MPLVNLNCATQGSKKCVELSGMLLATFRIFPSWIATLGDCHLARSSWRSECSQNGQISRSPGKRGLKPATTSSVRRLGTLVVAGFSPRSGSGHSPRYEARSLVLDHFRYRFAQEPSPTGALNTWLTSLPNVSYPPSPITNTQENTQQP